MQNNLNKIKRQMSKKIIIVVLYDFLLIFHVFVKIF